MTRPYIAPHRLAQAVEPWTQPKDYAEPIRFVPSKRKLSWLERFTLTMRLNGEALTFWFAMASIALCVGVVVGAYFGAIR